MNRRTFIVHSSLLTTSAIVLPNFLAEAAKIKRTGVQLYTLRSLLKDDCVDVLKSLGNLGYKEIESYPSGKGHFWGRSAKNFFQLAKDNGLKVISTHVPLGRPAALENTTSLAIGFEAFAEAFAKEGGEYLVCPYIDKSLRGTIEDYALLAKDLNKAGEVCRKNGIAFAYHNHDFEFTPLADGTIPYTFLLKNTDPQLVKMELDIYWASRAKQDVLALFKDNPGRFPLVHVKDMGAADQATVEVGSGTIDFKTLFAESKKAGIKHYFVEQDNCPGNPLDSVSKSISYLKKFRF